MQEKNQIQQTAYAVISIIGIGYLASIGSAFLHPIIFSVLFALFLNPIVKKIKSKLKIEWLSILAAFFTILLPIIAVLTLFSFQLIDIIEGLPSIAENFKKGINVAINKVLSVLPYETADSKSLIKDNLSTIVSRPISAIGEGLVSSTNLVFAIAIIFIYTFFMLYYRESFKQFIIHRYDRSRRTDVKEIINEIKDTVQSYVSGLGIVIIVLAVLNSIGLYFIGVNYAIFWGTMAGLLAVIPFIGSGLGGALPFFYSLATADYTLQPLLIVIYYIIIQQIEGNFITPKIVGNKVNINPFFAILALVFFGSFWGISGVILALPLISIIRIILGHFDNTKSFAILMSADVYSKSNKFRPLASRLFSSNKREKEK